MTTYLEAFPDYDDVLPEIEGFEDSSYRNDACPSMINPVLNLRLFLDYRDPAMREMSTPETESIRYSLSKLSGENMHLVADDGSDVLYECRDLSDMLEFIETIRAARVPGR